jgi:hypothetical protein
MALLVNRPQAGADRDQLAKNVCVAEEAKGWTPHVSTQR